MGFTGDTALLLDFLTSNIRAVDTVGVGKLVIMNNLTQGFIADTKDGKVRYLNVKEFLELMK